MPVDQPEDPRIRTKINRLDPQVDDGFYDILEKLRLREISVQRFQRDSLEFFAPLIASGHFDPIVEEAMTAADQVELLRRQTDHCRHTVLFYRVDEGEVHPPHHHFNVISTQIIVSGQVRIREYDRMTRTKDGQLSLQMVSDRTLGAGASFQASEWHRNVHWFQAIGDPAIIFNTNARGYEAKTFDREDGSFGRRYIDPTHFKLDGAICAEEFDEAEAQARFQGRALDEFPVPVEMSDRVKNA